MIPKYSFLLFCLFTASLLFTSSLAGAEHDQASQTQSSQPNQCKEEFPYLSVGDFNLTASNYSSITKSNKAVLVIVTADWCEYCCRFEENFSELRDNILSNTSLTSGQNVKIARATLENNPTLKDYVSKLPEFIFYYKDEPYMFDHSYEMETVGAIISKIITPYQVISTYSELKNFIENDIIVDKGGNQYPALKILGIYSKEDDIKDELKEFKKTANHYNIYEDLQFALTTKESVISDFIREKGTSLFPEYMRSTVLLIDRKKRIQKIDPGLDYEQLGDQIHIKGKELVEPLTPETQELFRRIKTPILLSFVDPTDEPAFISHLDMLTEVAKKFEGHINFAYMDNNKHSNRRELVGIFHDKVPAVGINLPNSPKLFPFPEDKELTKLNLIKFVVDFLDRKLEPLDPNTQPDKNKNKDKHPIYQLLKDSTEVTYGQFDRLVEQQGIDVALLLFNPSDDTSLESFCQNFNEVAVRFKALGIQSVRIAFYDLTLNPPPPTVQVLTSPMLVFLPAFHKNPPHKVYTDFPKATPIMKFIEKYADVRFTLPASLSNEGFDKADANEGQSGGENSEPGKVAPKSVSFDDL